MNSESAVIVHSQRVVSDERHCEADCPGLGYLPLSASTSRAIFSNEHDEVIVEKTVDEKLCSLGFSPLEKYFNESGLRFIKAVSPFGGVVFIYNDQGEVILERGGLSRTVQSLPLGDVSVHQSLHDLVSQDSETALLRSGGLVAECGGLTCQFVRGAGGSIDVGLYSSNQDNILSYNSLLFPVVNLSELLANNCSMELLKEQQRLIHIFVNNRFAYVLERRKKVFDCLFQQSNRLQAALIISYENLKDSFVKLSHLHKQFTCLQLDRCSANKKAELLLNYHVRTDLMSDLSIIYNDVSKFDEMVDELTKRLTEISEKLECAFSPKVLNASRIQ